MGWIGVDLDGTLAHYDGWRGPEHIGEPVGEMLFRVKRWIAEGKDVRIFTARCYPFTLLNPEDVLPAVRPMNGMLLHAEHGAIIAVEAIRSWCKQHVGKALPVTCIKDLGMIECWDDRAVQVVMNTGARADGQR